MAWSGRLDFQRTEVEFSAVALACACSPWEFTEERDFGHGLSVFVVFRRVRINLFIF